MPDLVPLHPDRARNVGGSEIASLFSVDINELGEKTYETRYELWHRKAGLLEQRSEENERMFWGRYQEAGIAAGLRVKLGWNIRKVRRYIVHPRIEGMAASLDYEVLGHPLGPGVVEIKAVDDRVYREWPEVEDLDDPGFVDAVGVPYVAKRREPPLRLQLQPQHQLACTGRQWALLAILVGGNKLVPIPYPRVETTIARIEAEVPAFWQSIAAGEPPPIDWAADSDTVSRLYGEADRAKTLDLRRDDEARALALAYVELRDRRDEAEQEREKVKARLLMKIGDANRAILGRGLSITAPTVRGGHVSYERKPHRSLTVHQKQKT
jgi:predicted phage-related endonuclease